MSTVSNAIISHDLHVHTILSSCCSDEMATPRNMIKRASELGIKVLGFANHLWDDRIEGASPWYAPQNFNHINKIREEIPQDTAGVRVLVGCETEYCGHGKLAISREVAEQLDYVLVPISHFHMKGLVVDPAEIATLQDVANLLVKRFKEAIELELTTGIAHPFLTLGYQEHDKILAYISDSMFEDCFGRAAERRVSIEIHPGYFPSLFKGEQENHHDETFLRMLSIAKQMGCCFHFGSDTHTLQNLDRTLKFQKCVDMLGITQKDILDI